MQIYLDQYERVLVVLTLIIISISFRVLLQLIGQKWVMTTAHTATLVLLPIITYVITSVISGNIALSLGMVGALSIVRFRNPVRSPLELSVYFAAITMGISASVSLKWLIFLVASLALAALTLVVVQSISKIFFKKPFFTVSFSEGNPLSTLEVKSTHSIDFLDLSDELTVKNVGDGVFTYILASSNFSRLNHIQQTVSSTDGILEYQLRK